MCVYSNLHGSNKIINFEQYDEWIAQISRVYLCHDIELHVNSLPPGRSECYSKNVIFNLALLIGIFKFSYDIVLR